MNFIMIQLWLVEIDLMKVAILLIMRQNVNLNVFNMITRINKAKILTKNISCDYNCKFDGKKLFQIKREVKTSTKIRWM